MKLTLIPFLATVSTQVTFLTLKLAGVLSWSWWWITAPAWIYFSFWTCVILGILMCGAFLASHVVSSILND